MGVFVPTSTGFKIPQEKKVAQTKTLPFWLFDVLWRKKIIKNRGEKRDIGMQSKLELFYS